MELGKRTRLIRVAAAATAATTAVNSSVIDMAGFEGVLLFGNISTGAANNIAKVQQGLLANGNDMADLANTGVAIASNDNQFEIDVYRPRERYLRLVITRGTSTATGDVYALLYCPRTEPVSAAAGVISETHISPAEGAA